MDAHKYALTDLGHKHLARPRLVLVAHHSLRSRVADALLVACKDPPRGRDRVDAGMDHDVPLAATCHTLDLDGNCSSSLASAHDAENSWDRDYTSVRNSRQSMSVVTQVYRAALRA